MAHSTLGGYPLSLLGLVLARTIFDGLQKVDGLDEGASLAELQRRLGIAQPGPRDYLETYRLLEGMWEAHPLHVKMPAEPAAALARAAKDLLHSDLALAPVGGPIGSTALAAATLVSCFKIRREGVGPWLFGAVHCPRQPTLPNLGILADCVVPTQVCRCLERDELLAAAAAVAAAHAQSPGTLAPHLLRDAKDACLLHAAASGDGIRLAADLLPGVEVVGTSCPS